MLHRLCKSSRIFSCTIQRGTLPKFASLSTSQFKYFHKTPLFLNQVENQAEQSTEQPTTTIKDKKLFDLISNVRLMIRNKRYEKVYKTFEVRKKNEEVIPISLVSRFSQALVEENQIDLLQKTLSLLSVSMADVCYFISSTFDFNKSDIGLRWLKVLREIEYLKEEIPSATWRKWIRSVIRNKRPEVAVSILEEMTAFGVKPDSYTHNIIAVGFITQGRIDEAVKFVENTKDNFEPLHLYNFRFRVLLAQDKIDDALKLIDEMKNNNVEPGPLVYSELIAKVIQTDPEKAEKYYTEAMNENMAVEARFFNKILSSALSAGKTEEVLKYYDHMKKHNVALSPATYNILLELYNSENQIDNALQILEEMHKQQMPISAINFSNILKHFITEGQPEKVKELYETYKDNILQSSFIIQNALIRAHSMLGEVDEVMKCYEIVKNSRPPARAILYNDVMNALIAAGQVDKALNVFEEMKQRRVEPNRYSYNILIKALKDQNNEMAEKLTQERDSRTFD